MYIMGEGGQPKTIDENFNNLSDGRKADHYDSGIPTLCDLETFTLHVLPHVWPNNTTTHLPARRFWPLNEHRSIAGKLSFKDPEMPFGGCQLLFGEQKSNDTFILLRTINLILNVLDPILACVK